MSFRRLYSCSSNSISSCCSFCESSISSVSFSRRYSLYFLTAVLSSVMASCSISFISVCCSSLDSPVGISLRSGSPIFAPSNSAVVDITFITEDGPLKISRVQSRESGSKYFINNQQCRRMDIREIFKGTGVGVDIYSIVGQGQVDKVVSSSPYELRILLEEAAGTAVYREKKREAFESMMLASPLLFPLCP